MIQYKKYLIAIPFLFLAFYLQGQESIENKNSISVDFVLSTGPSSMLNLKGSNFSQYSFYGKFENKNAHFFQAGFDIRKRMKRNSVKSGIHIGSWNYFLEGHKYLDIPFTNFEDRPLSEEKIVERIRFQRISIPLSLIIEAKNTKGLRIDHEIGLIADLYFNSNILQVEYAIAGVEDLRYYVDYNNFLKRGTGSIRNNLGSNSGLRLSYGISAELSSRLSLTSNLSFGVFDIYPFSGYNDFCAYCFDAYYYNQSSFKFYEFGLGARYNIF